MLLAAGDVHRDAFVARLHAQRLQVLRRQYLHRVAHPLGEALRPFRIVRIVRQQVGIVEQMGGAAAGAGDQGLGARLQARQPGVDVAPRQGTCPLGVSQVMVKGAAAAGVRHPFQGDAEASEQQRQGLVDLRRQGRLHAALQHQHPSLGGGGRWRQRRRARENLGLQGARQQGTGEARQLQQGGEVAPVAQCPGEGAASQALRQGARAFPFHRLAADVQQMVVVHPGGAGGLAGTAHQAAIQVAADLGGGGLALQHPLDLVDAPAGAVQLVAQELVGGAGGGAEAAVHAGAQDAFGLAACGGVADEVGQIGLHGTGMAAVWNQRAE